MWETDGLNVMCKKKAILYSRGLISLENAPGVERESNCFLSYLYFVRCEVRTLS